MQYFFDLFSFTKWELLALVIFVLLVIIQLYYYIVYYKLPYRVAQMNPNQKNSNSHELKKVSVIISSENEAYRLSQLLPIILDQNYPDFEVIVISDGSTDETQEVLDTLKVNHKNLYSTFIPYSNDKKFGRRKLAFTLGVKAANGDVLLFTEPHSTPVSKDWITLMVNDINENMDVVIGFSYFKENKKIFNRLSRFDNYLLSMQFISKTLKRVPFTGVYRNIAFKKDLFFDNKGFAAHLALENAEDLFINQIVNDKNTVVCLDKRSFTEADIDNFSLWKLIKKNYSLAKSNFKDKGSQYFVLESLSRVLFYIVFSALVVFSVMNHNYGLLICTSLLFIIRLVTQLVIINKGAKYFQSGKYYLSIIFVDLLQPIYNLKFRTRNKKI